MATTLSRFQGIAGLLCLASLVGCGATNTQSPLLRAAGTYDADAIAEAAFKQYDKNKSESIEEQELVASPSLRHFAGRKTTVSKTELRERVASYTTGGLDSAVISVGAVVKRKGTPVEGVTVTLIPEAFMGAGFTSVVGTTNANGYVEFRSEAGAGIPSGFYSISVSKKDESGKETIPAQYNSATREGREISKPPRSGPETIELNIAG